MQVVTAVTYLAPSIALGQTRKRLLAALPNTVPNVLLASAIAGAIQASVALTLNVPSALEKAPEHTALIKLSERDFWSALRITIMRNSAGFAVFFWVFDAVKSKLKNSKVSAKAAQNLLAATLAATFYRLTTWLLDGRLPIAVAGSQESGEQDEEEVENEKTFGGKRGGNPYEVVLQQLKASILKASISMVAMDLALGRPSW
ncbi:UNVERIFIED_CONTAM: hypothetical protein HDU68_005877 [Siphonaria sp. JEL0065]|nr:hypothetical protein HDU68_005877 [Siphonaria sp. JEL0065]